MRKNIKEIEVGTIVRLDFLYLGAEKKTNKNGKDYAVLKLCDGKNKFEAKHWDITPEQIGVEKGAILSGELKVSLYNDRLDYQITNVYPSTSLDVSLQDFIVMPPYDIDKMYNHIIDSLKAFVNNAQGAEESIASIAIGLIEKCEKDYKRGSAAVSMHHNCYGGLLYHTYEMFLAAEGLVNAFPFVDKEILLTAVAIHDIGKVKTYNTSAQGDAELNVLEVLDGHLAVGYAAVLSEAPRHNCNKEKVRLLAHMVGSHHGKQEWGAIQVPATPEAFLLFAIDYLDSRVNMYRKVQEGLEVGTFSNKQFALDNANVYRPIYQG